MLKIKDNVDLRELGNYGFHFVDYYNAYVRYYPKFRNASTIIYKSKHIENYDDSYAEFGIPSDDILLDDLIKADLVEKVE